MLKKTTALIALISFGSSIQAAQPRPLTVNANLKVTDIPPVPVTLQVGVSPHVLISGLGFAGCLAAIQLWKEGEQLCACQDADQKIRQAKHEQGNALKKSSYALGAASLVAILNKQILSLFIKQGK